MKGTGQRSGAHVVLQPEPSPEPVFVPYRTDEYPGGFAAPPAEWAVGTLIDNEPGVSDVDVRYASRSGRAWRGITDVGGASGIRASAGETWVRAGLRRAGSTAPWQWFDVSADSAAPSFHLPPANPGQAAPAAADGGRMVEAGDIITLTAGAWRLQALIRASSYGQLWRAESVPGGQPAAVKLVNRAQMDLAMPPQQAAWRDSFEAEIGFLRSLQPWDQRHIVRLLDSGAHDGTPALALELLDGDLAGHLATLRHRGRRPGVERALAWTAQVNGALAKVHQYGWRYLDLKPSNLLVDARAGTLKLADFGTNRPLHDGAAHAYAGTAAWQAPEQFFPDGAGRYRTDARSDYFALGVLLYHLVADAPLRYCDACADAYRRHGPDGARLLRARHGDALPPTLGADEAARFAGRATAGTAGDPAALVALLEALLAARPQDRPRHALDISRLLARAAATLLPAHTALRRAA